MFALFKNPKTHQQHLLEPPKTSPPHSFHPVVCSHRSLHTHTHTHLRQELERGRLREEGIESREAAAAALERSSLKHQDSLDKREVFLASRQADIDRSLDALREREEETMDRAIVIADRERAVQTVAEENTAEAARLLAAREAIDADKAAALAHFEAERGELARREEEVEGRALALEGKTAAAHEGLRIREDAVAAAEAAAKDREATLGAREVAAEAAWREREAKEAAALSLATTRVTRMEEKARGREAECQAWVERLDASEQEWHAVCACHDETMLLWEEDVAGHLRRRAADARGMAAREAALEEGRKELERDREALAKERRRVVMFAEECEAQHEENTREQDTLTQQREECAAVDERRAREKEAMEAQREESKALHEESVREREEVRGEREAFEALQRERLQQLLARAQEQEQGGGGGGEEGAGGASGDGGEDRGGIGGGEGTNGGNVGGGDAANEKGRRGGGGGGGRR